MADLVRIAPVLLVRDVARPAGWYRDTLGFLIDFLHGEPPFYGSVSRDGLAVHLRFVADPPFAAAAAKEEALIAAFVEVADVHALFGDMSGRGAEVAQPLTPQPWGGTDFHVRDPDGNVIAFVGRELA